MSRPREFLTRLAGLLRRGCRDDELEDEIRGHLAELESSNLRQGMSPADATRAAKLAFGNVAVVREAYRAQRSLPRVESVLQDLLYALRLLAARPGFTATAVLTLALGIGLNTTLFTVIDAVMFRPLPVRGGAQLVRFERWFASQNLGNAQYLFSQNEYDYIRDHRASLTDLIAAGVPSRVDAATDQPIWLQTVSPNYFEALGVTAAAGRVFAATDAAASLGVVLSYPFWQRQFAGNPSVVGRALRMNGTTVTIAGVAPEAFIGTGNPPEVPDVWAPMDLARTIETSGTATDRRFQVLGHLPPGGTLAAASTAASLLTGPLGQTFPAADPTTALTLERASFFGETNDPQFHQFVAALMTAVGLVLLIACANLANMLLARAAGRHKEIAMRLALGASRARVIRQLLTESVLLGMLGGAGGLALSLWGAQILWVSVAKTIQMLLRGSSGFTVSLTPDLRVFAYTVAVSVVVGLVFGLSPALRASRADLTATLREEGTSAGHGAVRSRLRSVLVGTQVMVSMALLLVAGLLLRGFDAARRADPGYDARRLYVVLFPQPKDRSARVRLQDLVAARLAARPEIASVSMANKVPMAGTWTPPMSVVRRSGRFVGRTLAARVSDGYFPTVGVPLLRGRNFSRHEPGAVAIVSQRCAQEFWPGENPLGRMLTLDLDFHGTLKTFEVIGIAGDVRTANLSRIDPSFVYLPVERTGGDTVFIRIAADPPTAVAAIRNELHAIDPALAVQADLISIADGPMRLQRMSMTALTAAAATLAIVALALAVAGIYGVASYLAAARRFEIAVRIALGARVADVLRVVAADSLRPVAIGGALGLAGAFALSALGRSLLSFPGTPDVLFGVSAFDAASFFGATALFSAVALAASSGPLWRSTRVDPLTALRG